MNLARSYFCNEKQMENLDVTVPCPTAYRIELTILFPVYGLNLW